MNSTTTRNQYHFTYLMGILNAINKWKKLLLSEKFVIPSCGPRKSNNNSCYQPLINSEIFFNSSRRWCFLSFFIVIFIPHEKKEISSKPYLFNVILRILFQSFALFCKNHASPHIRSDTSSHWSGKLMTQHMSIRWVCVNVNVNVIHCIRTRNKKKCMYTLTNVWLPRNIVWVNWSAALFLFAMQILSSMKNDSNFWLIQKYAAFSLALGKTNTFSEDNSISHNAFHMLYQSMHVLYTPTDRIRCAMP